MFKCEGYGHYNYQCPSESQHVKTVPTDVDESKVVEDLHVPSKTASIIQDLAIGSDTPIINEIHMSSDSASDDVDEIVESKMPIMPCKPFESPCAEDSFMVIPIHSFLVSHQNFLTRSSR